MERRNYQREMEAEIERLDGRRPSLLLHSCCGPCSSAVLERLTEHFRVTVLYYNPNIEPEAEFLHRLSEQQRLLSLLPDDIPLLPCDYGHEAFAAFAPALAEAPEGGERCLACFALRLGYTAEQAKLPALNISPPPSPSVRTRTRTTSTASARKPGSASASVISMRISRKKTATSVPFSCRRNTASTGRTIAAACIPGRNDPEQGFHCQRPRRYDRIICNLLYMFRA